MSVNDFTTVTKVYRGTTFVFEEADVATYDKCLKKATQTTTDPITGEDREEVNENMMLRLLLRECLREPKISDFSGIGIRLMRQLERDIRDLHFNAEPTTKSKGKKDEETVAEEDDDSPNDEG